MTHGRSMRTLKSGIVHGDGPEVEPCTRQAWSIVMNWKNVIALCGVAAILVAATAWSSRQEKATLQQPKSQVALEKEYYNRILPRLEAEYEHLHRLIQEQRVSIYEVEEVKMELLFAQRRCGKLSEKEYAEKSAPLLKGIDRTLNLFREEGRIGTEKLLKKLRRVEWLAVFGKADLNTAVGIPPWP